MKIRRWAYLGACLAAAVCLAAPIELGAQARVGGGRGGWISSGGARGGSIGRGARGGGFRGMTRGRSTGSIRARGLPSAQRVPNRVRRPAGGDARGSSRRAIPPARVGSSGFPGTDEVLLNPRTGRIHGNVVAPGTPGRFNRGNPITPGTPTLPGTRHRGVRPKILTFGRHFGRGHHFGIPVVYVPYGFGYGHTDYIREDYIEVEEEYLEEEEEAAERIPNVVYVDPATRTASGTEYVVQVQPDEPPASGKVFEVRPTTSPTPPPAREEPEGEAEAEPGEQRPAGREESAFYLIALRDGSIYTSREHWLEGDTLHYITRRGVHNLVSISEVDTDLTAQLNRERGLSFVLEVREDEE